MTLELNFPITPMATQSMRVARIGNFIRKYQTKETMGYKETLRVLALNQLPEDFEPYKTALIVTVSYCFPPLKSMSKKVLQQIKDEEKLVYKPTRPDLADNLSKSTFDALTGVVWVDDSQIVMLIAEKRYATTGSIRIIISEVEENV